jgi:hypothetical protein
MVRYVYNLVYPKLLFSPLLSIEERLMQYVHTFISRLTTQYPTLRQGTTAGLKVVLVQLLIEIPFLILESSLLIGALLGVQHGIALWQTALVAVIVYMLVESALFTYAKLRKTGSYRFLHAERVMIRLGWSLCRRLLQRRRNVMRGTA